jgi:hypothetical protein
MAADTLAPKPELRRSAYDFCEQALARFESAPNEPSPKGFSIARSQTISGDSVQRSYVLKFDLKLTGCELP